MQNDQRNALKGILWFIPLCLIVAGLGLSVLIPALRYSTAKGTVVSSDCTLETWNDSDGNRHSSYDCDISVTFKDSEGIEHTVSRKDNSGNKINEDAIVEVFYNKKNPEDFDINLGDTLETSLIVTSVSLAVIIMIIIIYVVGIRNLDKNEKTNVKHVKNDSNKKKQF